MQLSCCWARKQKWRAWWQVTKLFKVVMLEKCVLTVLELNWNKRLGHKKRKLNICHHMLTSSTQLQNRSFHVVERTRTSSKCQNMKNARAKRAKNTVFHCQICKFVEFLLPSSSWLRKLTFSFFLRREMTCFAVVWTTCAYDDKCSMLTSYLWSAASNLIPG